MPTRLVSVLNTVLTLSLNVMVIRYQKEKIWGAWFYQAAGFSERGLLA